MAAIDPLYIHHALQELRSTPTSRAIFGAVGHKFVLNPVLSETEVQAFETMHRISLPADYRRFLTQVGNGGAGPYYGIFPLGQMDGNDNVKLWQENDGFVGILSEPFLLSSDWNDLAGMPPGDLVEGDEEEYERQFDEFEKQYWRSSSMNGAIPICHEGCALRDWLVVTGEQAGRVWHDARADYKGLSPLMAPDGTPATFLLWYNDWLERVLKEAPS